MESQWHNLSLQNQATANPRGLGGTKTQPSKNLFEEMKLRRKENEGRCRAETGRKNISSQ
jgi:hypothetical protein